MEIRPITAAEHDALGEVTVEAYRRVDGWLDGPYEEELRDVAARAAGAVVLVAVERGCVVGGVTYVPGPANPYAEFDDPDAAGIRMLAVAPEAQRRGVGRALVLACIERAWAAGRARVVLHSTRHMANAQRLYRRLGFDRRTDRDWWPTPDLHLAGYELELSSAPPPVRAYDDARAFFEAVRPLLFAHEAEHTALITVLERLHRPADGRPDVLLLAIEAGGEVVGAAVQTPPHAVLLSYAMPARALDALVEHLAGILPEPTLLLGSAADAGGFVARWTARGGACRTVMRQSLMSCARVERPGGVPGVLHDAAGRDREQLARWVEAFTAEALPHEPSGSPPEQVVDRLLGATDSGLVVWEVDGAPVSMASYAAPRLGSPRIGFVYTPPDQRRHGYASACVAALTGRLLDAGYARVLLFTDLANPTSNRAYARIGYRPLGDFAQILLEGLT